MHGCHCPLLFCPDADQAKPHHRPPARPARGRRFLRRALRPAQAQAVRPVPRRGHGERRHARVPRPPEEGPADAALRVSGQRRGVRPDLRAREEARLEVLGRSGAEAARRDQPPFRRPRGLLRGPERPPPRDHHQALRLVGSGMRCFWMGAGVLWAATALAQPAIPAEDARAVRAVIEAQLDAFKRDDAPRAFSYAAPGIRETFGSAENFIRMVREQYAVVYRPSKVAFEAPFVAEGQLVQPVRFTDAEGRAWIALYPMERQADGAWRINGCYLSRAPGQQT